MSWRIRVLHQTGLRYSGPVSASYNEARMTPQSGAGQLTVEDHLEVRPTARARSYRDYWGTIVHAFDLHTTHDELMVTATSSVETSPRPMPPTGCAWEVLESKDHVDQWCEFRNPSQFVPPDPEFEEVGRVLRREHSPLEAVAVAVNWVGEHMEYVTGSTTVATLASEAYRRRAGVCQDFAHVLLGILRAAGIPARYASGYLHPGSDAPIGMAVTGQSHAWVEAWVGQWVPIDPTNQVPVGECHVLVATGRDYADVTPLKGIYNGGPAESLGVNVELTRVG